MGLGGAFEMQATAFDSEIKSVLKSPTQRPKDDKQKPTLRFLTHPHKQDVGFHSEPFDLPCLTYLRTSQFNLRAIIKHYYYVVNSAMSDGYVSVGVIMKSGGEHFSTAGGVVVFDRWRRRSVRP